VSGSVYPFDADREVARYLAGVKHLTRSGMRHLFFETYHFLLLDWRVPSICVTGSGVSNSKRDRLSV
jgi:hypothetical protein